MRIANVQDISNWRLCVGCGACASICPKGNISLIDIINDGIRPALDAAHCNGCDECLKVCPGYEMIHLPQRNDSLMAGSKKQWGPVLEMWEGYATDAEIRFQGSSGGITSALALYCLETEKMAGVLHVGSDSGRPYKNKTVFSQNRADLLFRTGSRYSPASPCDGLHQMQIAAQPSVFIGKPCDVAGLRKAQCLRPELDRKTGVAIGIFCAGTPSTQGTLDLLDTFRVSPDEVEEIRYRGKGWPGMASVRLKGEGMPSHQLSYKESWGFVQKYRPYRCYLCPDGTSEFADISCGDPWYRQVREGEQGFSLVLVRTERGRRILHGAMKEGCITLERADPRILDVSQKNLFAKRGAIWGRLLAMKAFGIPTPRLHGFSLFENWLKLSFPEKTRSIAGTVRRIVQRGYYKRQRTMRNKLEQTQPS